LRLKGLGSRFHSKKGYKISFNAFDKEKRFKGLKRLDLKGSVEETQGLKSQFSTELMRSMGTPTSRS
jgi:hypothetical protein